MRIARKLLILLLAMLTLASAGCGGSQKPGTSPAATGAASAAPAGEATAAPADLNEPITLTVARFDLPMDADSSDLFTTQGAKYYDAKWAELAKKFNVKITYRPVDYATRDDMAQQMIASGDIPGAVLATLQASECRDALGRGLIRALPAGFEDGYANIKANLDAVRRLDEFKDSGAYAALPRALETAEPYGGESLGVYYRKDLAARSGFAAQDIYTLDELYSMFERVQRDNPGLAVFSSVTPAHMLELGVAEAAPETLRGEGFYKDAVTGKYVYAFQGDGVTDGIKTFKKFYDAGFMDRDFNDRPVYEARVRFADGDLFCYADAIDIPAADGALKAYEAAHPGAAGAVGFAWIADNAGGVVAGETGNSWSAWLFGAKMDDKALTRFLTIYDYLLGPDGVALAVPGALGSVTPLVAGLNEDSRVCAANPAYSDAAKSLAGAALDARRNAANKTVLPFDQGLDGFAGENYQKASALNPAAAIAAIVRGKDADKVASAWQKWLGDNDAAIRGIIDGLNANAGK